MDKENITTSQSTINMDSIITEDIVIKVEPVEIEIKKKPKKTKNNYNYSLPNLEDCIIAYIILIGISIISFIITLFYFASVNKESICNSLMHPSTWLNIYAGTMLSVTFLAPVLRCLSRNLYKFSINNYSLFNFIWTIIGSTIYWRDCPDIQPQSFNNFMLATLIISWIIVCARIIFSIAMCIIKINSL